MTGNDNVPTKVDITQVKTVYKVAEAKKDSIGFHWEYVPTIEKSILKSKRGRVYLIVVDGIIKKIGGSSSEGGMKETLTCYQYGMSGRPSNSRFAGCFLIKQCLNNGSVVEIYMTLADETTMSVKGLFTEEVRTINSYKEMEAKFRNDYKAIVGDYPEWNFKERGSALPAEITNAYTNYLNGKLK